MKTSSMKGILALCVLMVLMASSIGLHADTYDPATNLLTIPWVQAGSATYSNVIVDPGIDYRVITFLAVGDSGGESLITADNYDPVNKLLTIPIVSVTGSQTYENVTVQLGNTFQVVSVGSCIDCSNSGGTASNVAPLLVDNGPIFQGQPLGTINTAFTSVTVCQSGTNNCQTFDHIAVDTGSSGFRVISSPLVASLNLTVVTNAQNDVAECAQFIDGYTWGTVKLADVKIAGEFASNIPIQIIGDNAYPVPSDCSSSGPSENTVDTFGANGIIGIANYVYDCGAVCANQPIPGTYYSCSGTGCQAIAAPLSQQVPNPVAFFSWDNNGTVIQLPAVPAQGAANVAGSLIFGIGTESNNHLESARIFTLDSTSGTLTTTFNGQILSSSFVDSGSNGIFFNDNSIPVCPDGNYCPLQPLALTATNQGQNDISDAVGFSVVNIDNLLNNPNLTAFSNLAYYTATTDSFDWGLPFFYGRSVFTAIENRNAVGAIGPYVAY